MEPKPVDECRDLLDALSASGFPMQTAVAAAIRSLGLYEVQEEIAWRDPDGADKFLDMVAVGGGVRVLIECKKTLQDKFIFLLPETGEPRQRQPTLRGVYLYQIPDSTLRAAVAWGRISTLPTSFDSMYCVTKTSSPNRLLETNAQALVRATEAYALDRCKGFRPQAHEAKSIPCIPVLITNAPLFVARYRPDAVSLDSGIYQARSEHLSAESAIRFTKQFTTSLDIETRERTVLIAHTSAIAELFRCLGSAGVVDNQRPRFIFSGV